MIYIILFGFSRKGFNFMKTKRLTLIVLFALMMSLLISLIGYADSEISGNCKETSVTYELNSNNELIISGEGEMPDYIDEARPWDEYASSVLNISIGTYVTRIGSNAFLNIDVDVTIPATVLSIGDRAFGYTYDGTEYAKIQGFTITAEEGSEAQRYADANGFEFVSLTPSDITGDCNNKISFTLTPDGVLTISGGGIMPDYSPELPAPWSQYAFGSGKYIIKKVIIEEGITHIGNYAFADCYTLKEYVAPDTLQTIGDYAFSNCVSLSSATIGNNVIGIGERAFQQTGLTSITLPRDIIGFGEGIFYGCTSLQQAVISSFQVPVKAFADCTSLTKVTMYTGVQTIEDSAFEGCTSLINASLPATLTKIGNRAFYGCSSISQIILPDSIKEFGAYSFAYCTKINNFVTNDIVKLIPEGMFYNCKELSNITVGDSVYTIDDYAFAGCTSLRSIFLSYKVKIIGEYAIGYEYSEEDREYVLISKFTTEIESFTPSVARQYAEENGLNFTNYKTVDTDTGDITDEIAWRFRPSTGVLNIIGKGPMPDYPTFESTPWAIYKEYIKQVTFSSGITNIGSCVFEGCYGVEHIDIPGTVQIIGTSAFAGTSVVTLNIPSGVREIANSAFEGCTMLYTVNLPATLTSIGQSAFRGPNSIITISIPQSVVFIGEYALGYSSNETTIDGYIIKAPSGSLAESYANSNGITFIIAGYEEITDNKSGCMISIPETNYDKLSISFEKIKVGSTLKDLVLLSDNQTTIIYNLNLLNDGKIINVAGPISYSVPIPSGMDNYIVNIYAIVDNKVFVPIDYQKVGDNFSFSYDKLGEFVLTTADLSDLRTITINYKYSDGTPASSTLYYKASNGASYRFTAKDIEGYTVDNTVLSGNVLDSNLTLEFIYTKNSTVTTPIVTTDPDEPYVEKDDSLVVLIVITILLFLTLIAALILLIYIRSKREKKAKETKRTMAAAAKRQLDSDKNARTMVVPDFATREIDIESLFADDPEEDIDLANQKNIKKNKK